MNLITVSGVKGYVDENGTAWLNLEDVARGLGFVEKKIDGAEYVRWSRVWLYLNDFGFSTSGENQFIPENIFYLLAMKASNQTAVAFQMKVANEILPSIRKTGTYSVKPQSVEDLIILQAQSMKEIRLAQQEQAAALADHEFKIADIDQKVTEKITLTTREQSQLQGAVAARVRKLEGKPFAGLHSALKREFGVPSYRDIRKCDLGRAFRFIESWTPSQRKWGA